MAIEESALYKLEPGKFDIDKYQPVPVAYELRASILKKLCIQEDPLPHIQGREETKRDVLRALLSGHNIFLVSEEGTGKTRLAKSITKLLPSIPRIKGCLYNDDPKWPTYLLCPRCKDEQASKKEYTVELISGEERFSRIQGNDYTDEAKLIGLKDIQAIIEGKSPSDARVFSATGAFRANRGILFIDELPAIRTKVQVLLHPILEEKKVILEEYNWEHPLDIVLIATGNPRGFSHVNEVPRPLLDRLELIYTPLPDREVEREIMLREKFKVEDNYIEQTKIEEVFLPCTRLEEIEREIVLPWWIIYLLNGAIDYSRKCSQIDKKPSLRASNRAINHTYSGAELDNRKVTSLRDACEGLKLALRGRVELRADLIDFDNPAESFKRIDELSEDLLWNALEDSADLLLEGCNRERLTRELKSLASEGIENVTYKLQRHEELNRVVQRMKHSALERVKSEFLSEWEEEFFLNPAIAGDGILEQYNFSAVETIYNLALHRNLIRDAEIEGKIFVPRMVSWANRGE